MGDQNVSSSIRWEFQPRAARSQVQSTMVGAVQYRGSIDAARTILVTERTLSRAWPAVALLVVYSVNQV